MGIIVVASTMAAHVQNLILHIGRCFALQKGDLVRETLPLGFVLMSVACRIGRIRTVD